MSAETILIAGGDAAIRENLASLLQNLGHRSDQVLDAESAIRYLQVRPDCALVLSALDLPETGSTTLLDSISLEFPEIPVILFAHRAASQRVVDAFRHGAFDFLSLPRERSSLSSIVDASLEHGRMRRQSLAYRRNLEELISERTRKLRVTMNNLERSYDITLEAMGDALDLRDAETQGHSQRVTAYTIALAKAMDLPESDLKVIAHGAFLHDIGKIAIPDSILLKPGKLTDQEMTIMREHCQRGYDMVRKIPFLDRAAEIVYAHQESFNGSGYPRGLKGDEIPLGARIFAIADTLDAMTSDRPYRARLKFAEAIAEIDRCSGTQFDPSIVAIFRSLPVASWGLLRACTDRNSQTAQILRSVAA